LRLLAPLLAVAFLAIAGCGSSSGGSGAATETAAGAGRPLNKAEFIAEADALCEASRAKQAPLRKDVEAVARRAREEEQGSGVSDGTRKELAQALGRVVAMAESSLSQVQAIPYPKADADQLEAVFKKTEAAFEASLAYGAALRNHEDANAQAIAEKANLETGETAALAKRYGFRVCGSQP
jgi:hypothetical protein